MFLPEYCLKKVAFIGPWMFGWWLWFVLDLLMDEEVSWKPRGRRNEMSCNVLFPWSMTVIHHFYISTLFRHSMIKIWCCFWSMYIVSRGAEFHLRKGEISGLEATLQKVFLDKSMKFLKRSRFKWILHFAL